MFNNKQLLKRIESIESELGIVWSVDYSGYGKHETKEDMGWGLANNLNQRIKKLEKPEENKSVNPGQPA